jgi:hypothetical protein
VLSVYTRHYPPCSKTDIHYGRCQCPKWIRGLLENTGAVRVSARTRSWHQAEGKSRVMEQADAGWVTLERAVEAYIKDDEGRNLSPATVKQRQAFWERRFLLWCRERHIFRLDQLRLQPLREFRRTWDTGASTAARWHERLRSFFNFCVASGWLVANPTSLLKKPLVLHRPPTDYFNRREFQQILDAAERYEYGGGRGLLVSPPAHASTGATDALEWSCHRSPGRAWSSFSAAGEDRGAGVRAAAAGSRFLAGKPAFVERRVLFLERQR